MKEYLENVRCVAPLIHNITNYVTANDVANVLLACGASPIMADEEAEVEEITAHCMGLNLNLGTLNQKKIPAMQKAGKMANKTWTCCGVRPGWSRCKQFPETDGGAAFKGSTV